MKKVSILNAILFFLLLGCCKLPPCGNFTFTGTSYDTATSNGIDMNVSFDFNPAVFSSLVDAENTILSPFLTVSSKKPGVKRSSE